MGFEEPCIGPSLAQQEAAGEKVVGEAVERHGRRPWYQLGGLRGQGPPHFHLESLMPVQSLAEGRKAIKVC